MNWIKTTTMGMLLLCGGLARAGAAETLLVNYFDIQAGSAAGTEVCGRINLMSNREAHHTPIPADYRLELTADASGLFVLDNQRDSASRLFGALKVAPGRALPAAPGSYKLSVALRAGGVTVAQTNLTVQAVTRTVQDKALAYLDPLARTEVRFYGRRKYTDAQVAAYIEEIEKNRGGFADLGFYKNDVLSYVHTEGKLGEEWEEASNRIGGLGYAYRLSKTYGPGGDAAARLRLKKALYTAIDTFTSRVPVAGEDLLIDGKPISTNFGDGFARLTAEVERSKKMWPTGDPDVLDYHFISHPWRVYDALSGPAIWLLPDLTADIQAGDPVARRVQEQLVRIFQLAFSNPANYQKVNDPDGRWGVLTDANHTEGAYADANLGHRLRTWMILLGIWNDYNRPITYMPNWYPGYYAKEAGPDFLFMPGWVPQGVLSDLTFWVKHFHRPAHYFVQSGFHPDGTVSHHLPDSSDIAMHAYGYGWLVEVIDGYTLLRDAPVDLGSHGYQFIADRLLYSYDKMIYNGGMDFAVCGRSYSGSMKKFVEAIPEAIDELLAAKQPGTVITNEAELKAWRDALVQKTQAVSGNYPFWVGQFMVHRRGGGNEKPCYYSVKLKNDRTNGAEDFDKVSKSYHAGSGILQVKVRGDEYEDSRYQWDWHALPGLTDELRTDPIGSKGQALRGASPFAGMASDGRYGFAAMEYRAYTNQYASARADKAFFFTETEAVALGCDVARVNAGQGREIMTTVDQTLWVGEITYCFDGKTPVVVPKGEKAELTVQPGQPGWVHQGQVGYVVIPQGAQPVYIRAGTAIPATDPNPKFERVGINSGVVENGKAVSGVSAFHLALGHGIDPQQSGLTRYCYILAANKTAAEMPAYLADVLKRLVIVANGDGVQGIVDQQLGLTQLAFYKAGGVSTSTGLKVSVDRPALLQLRRDGGQWTFCATDPLHDPAVKELNLKLNQPLAPGVYAYQLGGIYPQPGETVAVEQAGAEVNVKVQLPDMSDDARYHYQAPLYAGMPVQVKIPAKTK